MNSIAVLGCGNIGTSILEGLLKSKESDQLQFFASRKNLDQLDPLREKGVHISTNNKEIAEKANYLIIAVKPYKVAEILNEIRDVINENHVVISVASEVSLAEIEEHLPKGTSIFRAMPNTASAIQESISCISAKHASKDQVQMVEYLFSGIGRTIVIDEELMGAATILGACGIAYAMRFIRAMIQGGIQLGFDAKTASKITTQTVKGAADLIIQNNSHPEMEIDKVTTPKGCTITGLNEMEHQGFSSALIQGIVKSFDKIDKTN
ncbi:MAG: pyrroline-5-carboxylate reductase [Flavobacteriales bacterium]|nr:pyrroline-5-carboxylate reductase [Flavobacteriales bacterium]